MPQNRTLIFFLTVMNWIGLITFLYPGFLFWKKNLHERALNSMNEFPFSALLKQKYRQIFQQRLEIRTGWQ